MRAWCDYQERSHIEVVRKLRTWGWYGEDLDAIVAALVSHNYLNEERFARAYASGKFRMKGWGRIRIQQGLKQHRVSNYSLRAAMEEIDPEEYRQTLLKHIERKSDQYRHQDDWSLRARLHRYLTSKGFEPDDFAKEVERFLAGRQSAGERE